MDNVYLYAIITWFLFIPIAILNGYIREKYYISKVGDLKAHQISTFTASLAFIFLSFLILNNKISDLSILELLSIGAMWVTMTIIFEFGFGHFIAGSSWNKLIEDYNIFKGRIWGIFLITVFLTPLIINLIYKTINN